MVERDLKLAEARKKDCFAYGTETLGLGLGFVWSSAGIRDLCHLSALCPAVHPPFHPPYSVLFPVSEENLEVELGAGTVVSTREMCTTRTHHRGWGWTVLAAGAWNLRLHTWHLEGGLISSNRLRRGGAVGLHIEIRLFSHVEQPKYRSFSLQWKVSIKKVY